MGHTDRTVQSETSDQSRYAIHIGELAHDNYELDLTLERAGWRWSSLCMAALAPGKPLTTPAGECEYLILPLSGGCTAQISGEHFEVAGHEPIFTDIADYVYIPRRTKVTLINADGVRIALPGSRTTTDKPLRCYPRSEVGTGLRGADPSSHQVNNCTLGSDVETSHLLTCEVLTPEGSWSSYPPHKHDEHTEVERILEEIYYYQVHAKEGGTEGFALQHIYPSPNHDIDVCTGVRGGDIVVMPYGYRGSSVAAPGYDLYYLNAMAGPVEDSAWLMTDDPHHTQVRQTWEGQEVDPRLPITPMSD